MTTKRTIIDRSRRGTITAEALELFLELEAAPQVSRGRQDWKDKSKRLAGLLGLSPEWWMVQHVNDRSSGPCHPPHMCAHEAWHRVRAVRQALLEAAKEGEEARECPQCSRKPT
jgi:hypothetical protein